MISFVVESLLLMFFAMRLDCHIAGEGEKNKLAFVVKRSVKFTIKPLTPLDNVAVQLEVFYV
jgi:hypothetical protein